MKKFYEQPDLELLHFEAVESTMTMDDSLPMVTFPTN